MPRLATAPGGRRSVTRAAFPGPGLFAPSVGAVRGTKPAAHLLLTSPPQPPTRTREKMIDDRKFGFVVGGAFLLLGIGTLLGGSRPSGAALSAGGAVLVLLAAAAPRLLDPVRRAWTSLARVLGRVNTAVFLALVFFLVLTPLALVLRLSGRDELALRRQRRNGWVPYPDRNRDPRHFEKMF